MPENKSSEEMIKFAGMGKPAKFGDAFGQMMQGKVNAGVETIRQKVAAKLGGLDPTGDEGDGAEEGGNKNSIPDEDTEMKLTPEEEQALDADEPEEETTGEEQNEDSETNN